MDSLVELIPSPARGGNVNYSQHEADLGSRYVGFVSMGVPELVLINSPA